jgi:hypothetical protein
MRKLLATWKSGAGRGTRVSFFLKTKVPGTWSALACGVLAATALAALLMAGQLMSILNRGMDHQTLTIDNPPTTQVTPG